MNKVFLSPEAARDISQIKRYISTELKNRNAASRIVGSIVNQLRTLERFPEQGPSIEALTGFQTDLRMLVCGKHIALYGIDNETVFVARVLVARQDYLRVLFGDDHGEAPQQTTDIEMRVSKAKSLFGIIADKHSAVQESPPGRETIAAMREAERIARSPHVKGDTDTEELFAALNKDN